MATPTSASNRSKRKTTKPVTQGQNPQRANRQKVSNAKVSNANQRTNTGSAKVTTSKAPKSSDPWKAPTPQNSRTKAPTSNTQFRTGNKPITLPNSRAQGTNLPRAGAQQLRSATQGPRASSTPSPKPSGSFKAPSIPKPTAAAPKPATGAASRIASGAGKVAGVAGKALGAAGIVGAMASEVKAMSDRNKTFSWNRPKVKPDANGRSSTGVRVSDKANQRDYKAAPTGSQQYNDYRNQQIAAERQRLKGVGNPPAAKPKPPAPTQSGGGSTQSRGSSSAPAAPRRQPGPAADAGMKNQDKDYRGNLFEKTFGYKPGKAPDQQKARFKSVDNKFGQDSGYEPQTKVDGSKYADKKPDMKKVKEYDRLRRKYYD